MEIEFGRKLNIKKLASTIDSITAALRDMVSSPSVEVNFICNRLKML